MEQEPNDNSLLFDLDGTLFNFEPFYSAGMRSLYPEYQKVKNYPMTDSLVAQKKLLGAELSMQVINSPGFYIKEHVNLEVFKLIQKVIDQGEDVWFVTGPLASYHLPLSRIAKQAQIRRLFGAQMANKIIYSYDKHRFKGRYLLDDHPNHPKQAQRATWTPILVDQEYNQHVTCERRLKLETAVEDYLAIMEADVRQQTAAE